MKLTWMIALIALASCGKVETDGNVQLGKPKLTAQEKLDATDISRIQSICNALKEKEVGINALLGTDYVFNGFTKGCTDSAFAAMGDATVKLVDQSGYKFVDGVTPYYFADFETSSSGILGQICNSLTAGFSPILINSEYIFFDVDDSTDCTSGGNQQCIRIEKGIKSSETEAKIYTREWIKVKLDQPNLGFWTFKKRISQSSCVDGYYFGRSATLK